MAKHDFDDYYNKIFKQYNDLQVTLEDISKQVSEGMVEPERLEALKNTVTPVLNTFQTLSYIKYLLDKPNRKGKRYNNMLLKRSGKFNGDNIINNNKDIINNLKI